MQITFFQLLRGTPPDTPFFSSRAKDFYYSDKGIKTGKVGRIDMKIANIFFIGNKIFSKMLAKGMHQIPKIEFENCNFFQLLQTPHFFLFIGQRFIIALAKVSKQERREE